MRRHTPHRRGILWVALLAWYGVASAQSWLPAPTPTAAQGGAFKPGSTALQLTDGTIMVQEYASSTWWKLTPDEHANYNTGTWSKLASSVAYNAAGAIVPYAPRFFASAVLKDGSVIVEGGEYTYNVDGTSQGRTRTNMGAIFDPTKGPIGADGTPIGAWTPVLAPLVPTPADPFAVWQNIGDAPSIVLDDGTFMLGNIFSKTSAVLDEATLKWKIVDATGKSDRNSEEGWTLLPGGNVLTIDTGNPIAGLPNNSEIFNPGATPATTAVNGTWTTAHSTVRALSYLACAPKQLHEIGPAVLRPDGTVFATGVNTCGGAGHTAIYDTKTGSWAGGKDIPCDVDAGTKVCNDMADAPAAVLLNGNVLVQTSPGSSTGNSTFYEFELGTDKFSAEIPPPTTGPGFTQTNSEPGRMLVVSSGHVFYMRSGEPGGMWFYVPQGTYDPAWTPFLTKVTDNGICVGCINRGQTYVVSGTQLNGLSGGAAYGDDAQSASNYPLVLIENCRSHNKYFARTHDFSTMGVATGLLNVVTAEFTVAPNTELGPSSLIVIANGIPSQPFFAGCSTGGFFTVEPELKGN